MKLIKPLLLLSIIVIPMIIYFVNTDDNILIEEWEEVDSFGYTLFKGRRYMDKELKNIDLKSNFSDTISILNDGSIEEKFTITVYNDTMNCEYFENYYSKFSKEIKKFISQKYDVEIGSIYLKIGDETKCRLYLK
jgi:hypothetical protein